MKRIAASIFCVLLSSSVFAQASDDGKTSKEEKKATKQAKNNEPPKKGDFYFSPLPVIGVNPAMGFIYGVGAAASSFLGDPLTTKISSALVGIAFTTKSQTIITLKSTVYTEDNSYILMGDWRFLNSSQPTWGLGTGPQSAKLASNDFGFDDGSIDGNSEADMLEFTFFRFHETVLKKVGGGDFYVGVGFHLDLFRDYKDNLLNLTDSVPVITPFYAYNNEYGFSQNESSLIGLSVNGIYDTRDNINNPWEGRYAFASFRVNPEFIGSDISSTSLWLEYREYFKIGEGHKNIVAIWTTGNFTTSGKLPYMNLPASGWDQYAKTSEPYAQGRFRGANMIFAGAEFRKHLLGTKNNPDFFGMVAYVNGTTADGYTNGIGLFDYVEPGYGLGLRINLSQKSRTNIAIDYGWGNYNSTGLFIRLNENF